MEDLPFPLWPGGLSTVIAGPWGRGSLTAHGHFQWCIPVTLVGWLRKAPTSNVLGAQSPYRLFFFHFWAAPGLPCRAGVSPSAVAHGGCSLVVVHRPLTMGASPAWSTGPRAHSVVVCGLSCSAAWNLSSPTRDRTHVPCTCKVDSSTLDHQGSPCYYVILLHSLKYLGNY